MEEETNEESPKIEESNAKNHKKYRKDKPWDSESIDHWKIDEWKPEDNPNNNLFLEESS
jgi:ribosomal RNA assembly protein